MDFNPEPYQSKDPDLNKMRAGVIWRFPISLREKKFVVRPLTIVELEDVDFAVTQAVNKLPIERRTNAVEGRYRAKEILKLASTSAPGEQDGCIHDPLFKEMTPDELVYLFEEWNRINNAVNPVLEQMSRDDLNRIVEALKKSPDRDIRLILTELSTLQLGNLVHFLLTKGD